MLPEEPPPSVAELPKRVQLTSVSSYEPPPDAAALAAAATNDATAKTERDAKRDADREADAVFAKLKSMIGPKPSDEE